MGFGKYFGEIEVNFQFCGVVGCAGLAMVFGTAETVAPIPKESIEQVLSATDIVDLVGSYIQLKRAGSQFRANCPFHTEKTPSFYVTPSMQRFHCFGCGKGGDAISFVCDYENLPFTDAVRKLASKAGIHLNEDADDPHADAKRKVRRRLLDLHREAAENLERAGLGDEAHKFRAAAEKMEQEIHRQHEAGRNGHHPPAEMVEKIHHLQRQLEEMRKDLHQQQEQIEALRKQVNSK